MATPSHELETIPGTTAVLFREQGNYSRHHLLSGVGFSLMAVGNKRWARIRRGEGGYNNFGSKVRGSLPLGGKDNNLEDFRMGDHHGVGWDWTFETNKYGRIGLRHVNYIEEIIEGCFHK